MGEGHCLPRPVIVILPEVVEALVGPPTEGVEQTVQAGPGILPGPQVAHEGLGLPRDEVGVGSVSLGIQAPAELPPTGRV